MDALPIELDQLIFEYVHLGDLFNLRLTCKRLRDAASAFRIKELAFEEWDSHYVTHCGSSYERAKANWFYIDKPVDQRMLVFHLSLNFLNCSSFNFTMLKKLRIVGRRIDLNTVNRLANLEQLELHCEIHLSQENRLCLPKLKALSLIYDEPNCKLTIDAPALEALSLSCAKGSPIQFAACSVKHLRINQTGRISNFKHVQFLSIKLGTSWSSDDFDPSKHPELKELHLDIYPDEYYTIEPYNSLVNECMKKRDQLGMDFKIFVLDIQVVNNDDLIEKELDNRSLFKLINNYSLSSKNPQIFHVDFNWLTKFGQLPTDFFEKLNNIRGVTVSSKVNNPCNLLKFLGNCQTLSALTIWNSGLGQTEFYDRLPDTVNSLMSLEIKDSAIELDFEFVGNMHYLQNFVTSLNVPEKALKSLAGLVYLRVLYLNQEIPPETIELILRRANYLQRFCFPIRRRSYMICGEGKTKSLLYSLSKECRPFKEGVNQSEMVKLCKWIRENQII